MEFKSSHKLIDYQDALLQMEERVEDVILDRKRELTWFLEHNAIITAGTSAKIDDLLNPKALPIIASGRGGGYTYHGPGQRVIYLIINLRKRTKGSPDIKNYIYNLEQIVINSLDMLNVKTQRISGKIGVWVDCGLFPEKIAAIGIRIRKWVTYHGIAINLSPDLKNFGHIIPCGIKDRGITSLEKLGVSFNKNQFDISLKQQIIEIFGE